MPPKLPEGDFVEHRACLKCDSTDGMAYYSSGTGYCYVCETYFANADGGEECSNSSNNSTKRKSKGELLETGDYRKLTSRGLSAETCRKFDYSVGRDNGKPVQIATYRKGKGKVAQHIRSKDKGFSWKGKAKILELFGQHLWAKGGKRLVITEGEIDCMTISECQDNKWAVVSVPNGAQSAHKYILQNLEYVESFGSVVLAFDDDKEGQKAVEKCVTLLSVGKVKVMSYDGFKDANELYLERGRAAVISCIYNADEYRPDGIVNGADIWDRIKNPPKPGLSLPYPVLSKQQMGIRGGELWMFTAGSGIGKSTVVNEIGYDLLMRHGVKLGIMALEESVRDSADRYIGIQLNKRVGLTRQGISQDQYKKAWKTSLGNGKVWLFDHWGSTDIDNLMAKLRYMLVGLGV
ncbi:toprim domain-containing protein, partial [Halodesulfovibrio sp.]|uniref:toprim domain-containing protein n=1 Tax=Halodesulfovibrio sp. TaxID=1912772 RepID=UPI0025D35AE3